MNAAPVWPAGVPIAAIATLFVVSFVGLQVFRPSLGDRQIFGVRSLPRDPLLTDVALEEVEKALLAGHERLEPCEHFASADSQMS